MTANYAQFVENEGSYSRLIEQPAARALLGSLSGLRVLDAGCGNGHSTFFLEELQPEKLVGVDFSQAMIARALAAAQDRKSAACFVLGDAERLAVFQDGCFDLIFSSTTTQYFATLLPFFDACRRALTPKGRLVLSVIHPVYSAQYPIFQSDNHFPEDEEWAVRYLDHSLRGYVQPWVEFSGSQPYLSRSYHHTFSDYLQAMNTSGFRLKTLVEPAPPEIFRQLYPSRYAAYLATPTFALLDCSVNG